MNEKDKQTFREFRDIDPVPYGCPPCIHYLHNHNTISCTSRPCCEEDDVIMNDWKRTSPVQFELWNKHQRTSINNHQILTHLMHQKKC